MVRHDLVRRIVGAYEARAARPPTRAPTSDDDLHDRHRRRRRASGGRSASSTRWSSARSKRRSAERGAAGSGAESASVLCDDARIRALNAQWRGIDKPTNVLSFPAAARAPRRPLGDIAIAFETVAREARGGRQEPRRSRSRHMIVHGFLHLLGYDHENDDEAEAMEALEREILACAGHRRSLCRARRRRRPQADERAGRAKTRPTRRDRAKSAKPPILIDRLRALFGLAGASIRDDIEDALEDTGMATISPRRSARC